MTLFSLLVYAVLVSVAANGLWCIRRHRRRCNFRSPQISHVRIVKIPYDWETDR